MGGSRRPADHHIAALGVALAAACLMRPSRALHGAVAAIAAALLLLVLAAAGQAASLLAQSASPPPAFR